MADAAAMRAVAAIVSSDPDRRYVVVSAPGKRSPGDIKVTDQLFVCAREIETEGNCEKAFAPIAERFRAIVAELGLSFDIEALLNRTRSQMEEIREEAFTVSRGEYLSAVVFSRLIGYPFLDAAEFVRFDEEGNFDAETTNRLCSAELKKHANGVIPGFYGGTQEGKICTFSRGGSDITGAIAARAVLAGLYENWTDVNGFLVTDPGIVKNARTIEVLTYSELRELAYMGASVLHSEAIFPVRISNIPINIRNTFEPENPGTMIVPDYSRKIPENVITGVAGRKNFAVIQIEKSMMNSEIGFARKVLSVLEEMGISFEHMPTGIDTMSLVIEGSQLEGKINELISSLKAAVHPDCLVVKEGLALIAIVGQGMCKKSGTAARLCSAISRAGVNLNMIDQGSSEMNIIISVRNEDYEKSIRSIYEEFVPA